MMETKTRQWLEMLLVSRLQDQRSLLFNRHHRLSLLTLLIIDTRCSLLCNLKPFALKLLCFLETKSKQISIQTMKIRCQSQ